MARSKGISVAATVLALAVPTVANATTYTVDQGAPAADCSASTTTCQNIHSAVASAASGDTIDIHAGTYTDSVSTASKNLTFTGAGRNQTVWQSQGATDTLTVPGGTVSVSGLSLLGTGGAHALTATNATGVTLAQANVVRAFTQAAPAVLATNTPLEIDDSLVANTNGSGVASPGGSSVDNLTLLRDVVLGTTSAVDATSAADAAARTIKLESTALSGGGTGLTVTTSTSLPVTSAGNVTVTGRHVTIAGVNKSVVLNSSAAQTTVGGSGSIAATFSNSIVHGPHTESAFAGTPPLNLDANTATLSLGNSDTSTPDDQLFVDPANHNFHLLSSAPVIDQGTTPPGGESAKDFDGDDRVLDGPDADTTAVTDLGADEWTNHAPIARITASPTSVDTAHDVTYDASGSADPDRDSLTQYVWSFGDGQSATTSTATTTHRYAAAGNYAATVHVVDALGAASPESAAQPIVVTAAQTGGGGGGGGGGGNGGGGGGTGSTGDHTPPDARITGPRNKAKFRLGLKQRLTVRGRATDDSGVRVVRISVIHLLKGKKCTSWSTGKRRFVASSCAKVLFFRVTQRDRDWFYTFPKKPRLPKGTYLVLLRATDFKGNVAKVFVPGRTFTTFTLR